MLRWFASEVRLFLYTLYNYTTDYIFGFNAPVTDWYVSFKSEIKHIRDLYKLLSRKRSKEAGIQQMQQVDFL